LIVERPNIPIIFVCVPLIQMVLLGVVHNPL
jgi:hypothetical protein